MLSSPVDIAMIAGVILLIFGPKKVPEFGKALGQGIGNFKKALTEAQDEFHTAVNTEPKTDAPASATNSQPASTPATAAAATTPAPATQPESAIVSSWKD